MSAIDAGVVFLPRFTTLVGDRTFYTAPLDVSRLGGVQFQVWRGPVRTSSGSGSLSVLLRESLDGHSWSLPGSGGPTAGTPVFILENAPHFFSYSFRLRWFQVGFVVSGTSPMVTCWSEGLLRGGGEGMWGSPRFQPAGEVEGRAAAPVGFMDPYLEAERQRLLHGGIRSLADPKVLAEQEMKERMQALDKLRKQREERMAIEIQQYDLK